MGRMIESSGHGAMDSRYPDDWQKIATALKEKEQWRCHRCGVQCISPHRKPLHGFRDPRQRIYLLQVHHWDGQPENNDPSNLVCLCTCCHLYAHRRQGVSVTPGQLRLFNVSLWQTLPPRAEPKVERPVQLQIPTVKTQLCLPLVQPLDKSLVA
jgi:hypothetical protein